MSTSIVSSLIPPDPHMSFIIFMDIYTDDKGIQRVKDVVISHEHEGLGGEVREAGKVLYHHLDTIFP